MTEKAEVCEKPKSEITINIKSPILYLTNSTLNSLYLYFKNDPEEQDNKELIRNRKKLLTCILKYGKVSELVSQKKRKTRKIIWNIAIHSISLEIQNYGDIYRVWRKTRLDLKNIKFKTIENLSKILIIKTFNIKFILIIADFTINSNNKKENKKLEEYFESKNKIYQMHVFSIEHVCLSEFEVKVKHYMPSLRNLRKKLDYDYEEQLHEILNTQVKQKCKTIKANQTLYIIIYRFRYFFLMHISKIMLC